MRRVQPYLPQDVRRARQIESTFPGTLGGTLITSPVRRRYPAKHPRMAPTSETCPDPWAWYRGDDIVESVEGAEVTFWEDRTGNGRHLDDSFSGAQSPYPLYTLDAVGGHPGLKRDTNSDVELAATYVASPVVFDEVSVLYVVQAPTSGQLNLSMEPADAVTFFGIELSVYADFIIGEAGGAYAEGSHSSPVCAALMVQSSTELRLWVNGAEITYDFRQAPTGQSQSNRHIAEMTWFSGTDAKQAELKIWDVALDEGCVAEEWTAAQTRYGL